MIMVKQYPSKVLLFGEYTVINGSKALALPFHAFQGHWTQSTAAQNPHREEWNKLLDYYHRSPKISAFLNLEELVQAVSQGWHFESSIPTGYGLGSSGALCAAIFDRFNSLEHPPGLPTLKDYLSILEGGFHGKSSGLDPLVSYLNLPVLLEKNTCSTVSYPQTCLDGFFLLDTGIKRETAPLVKTFLKACEDPAYAWQCQQILAPETDLAIELFLRPDHVNLHQVIEKISGLQWTLFQSMIPDGFKDLWKQGLQSKKFFLKLCGAGGGGFLLGWTANDPWSVPILKNWKIIPLQKK